MMAPDRPPVPLGAVVSGPDRTPVAAPGADRAPARTRTPAWTRASSPTRPSPCHALAEGPRTPSRKALPA